MIEGDILKVLLIDDDKLVCQALKTILESNEGIEVVGVAYDGIDALELFEKFSPDILLMDIRMTKMTGLEAAEIILKKYSNAKILFLTTFAENEYIIKALQIGSKGYLLKQDFESIVPALNAVMAGQSVFGNEITFIIPKIMSDNTPNSLKNYNLNEKEIEIITLVAEGLTNKEIAGRLYLGEGTIRNYISVILDKLGLRDRTQLAIFYYKASL